ncbi:hypothetical protein DU472_04495 [Campylobacter novaezeelandiae]|uniref:hypothetical protein n=1 Tax=Campylobacter novaezeelandiae TaxID=2267891 RepID=UPI001037C47D|nr:hypothetical protein [Campylobacter novaezeelandiae]TBR80922.1 hypothetical protein DU472_04495 [Campylobacter novaezeelandiae]
MKKIIIIAKESDIRIYKDLNVAKSDLKEYFDAYANKEYTEHNHASIESFVDKLNTIEDTIEFLVEDNYDLSLVIFIGKTYLL